PEVEEGDREVVLLADVRDRLLLQQVEAEQGDLLLRGEVATLPGHGCSSARGFPLTPAKANSSSDLGKTRARLQWVYAGQPVRKTDRPRAELMLGVLKTVSISVIEVSGRVHALLSPLTEVQKRLLELWDLPPDLYEKVAHRFPEPP